MKTPSMSDYKTFFSKHKDLIVWLKREGEDVVIEVKTQGPEERVKTLYDGERTVRKWKRHESILKIKDIKSGDITSVLDKAVKEIYKKLHPENGQL